MEQLQLRSGVGVGVGKRVGVGGRGCWRTAFGGREILSSCRFGVRECGGGGGGGGTVLKLGCLV
jgi:hypothetical protein